jgi:hypothetical protein
MTPPMGMEHVAIMKYLGNMFVKTLTCVSSTRFGNLEHVELGRGFVLQAT